VKVDEAVNFGLTTDSSSGEVVLCMLSTIIVPGAALLAVRDSGVDLEPVLDRNPASA
jgi:hypothetical protein